MRIIIHHACAEHHTKQQLPKQTRVKFTRWPVLTRLLISHCRTSAQVTQPRAQTAMTTHIVCSKKCNHGYNEVTYVYVQNHRSLFGRYGLRTQCNKSAHCTQCTNCIIVCGAIRTRCAPRPLALTFSGTQPRCLCDVPRVKQFVYTKFSESRGAACN